MMWPAAPWRDLRTAFFGQSQSALSHRAGRLGVHRTKRDFTLEAIAKFRLRIATNHPRLGTGNPVTAIDGVSGKHCRKCGTWKPLEKFGRKADCSGGVRNFCSTCKGRIAYARNPERCKATVRKWQKSHPATYRLIKQASNRRRHGHLIDGAVSAKSLRERWEEFGARCGFCLGPANANDHMTPISRGGRHEIANIVPACRSCNSRKHDKTLLEVLLQGTRANRLKS